MGILLRNSGYSRVMNDLLRQNLSFPKQKVVDYMRYEVENCEAYQRFLYAIYDKNKFLGAKKFGVIHYSK